jgi:hypothetical protein
MRNALWVASGVWILVVLGVVAGCSPAAPPASSDGVASTRAASYAEYAAATCGALQSIWRGYGNPDTSEMSAMYRAFDASVQAGDTTTAATQAGEIVAELERGRASVEVAAGWPPGLSSSAQLDRLLLAMEAMVRAKLDAMPLGNLAATNRGQAAFEAAGGIDAWMGMLTGIDAAMKTVHQPWPPCEGVPIG